MQNDTLRALLFRDSTRVDGRVSSLMFVDPGLNGTGWALYDEINPKAKCPKAPVDSGVIRVAASKYKEGWLQHCELIASVFHGVVAATNPHYIVIEHPELWSGSATSHASSRSKDGEPGDLFKLAYLIGQFGMLTKKLTGSLPILIFPTEWKGQLPKDAVLERIKRLIGLEPRDHEGDAIGMGLAAQGAL